MLEEFREWQFDSKNQINEWTSRLVKEALKQGEVGKAEDWLKRIGLDQVGIFMLLLLSNLIRLFKLCLKMPKESYIKK